MLDTTNGSLDPADPPETHPPGSSPQTDSDSELADALVADPPETQPPKNA
jgi:hypothetical protein